MAEPPANLETEQKEEMLPPAVVISTDIPSFPTKYRLKKPISRMSLATDRFSSVSFMTSSQMSDLSCLPRWRSLPNNLRDGEELFYNCGDDVDLLKPWSNYRMTNMSRRYKTMDYINVMVEEADEVVYNGEAACDLSTIVGLSVSRDFLNCRPIDDDFMDGGSGVVAHSTSDEHLYCNSASEFNAAKQHLTEANVNFVLASSRACSCEHLDPSHRNDRKIEQWLQRCNRRPSQDELAAAPYGNKL